MNNAIVIRKPSPDSYSAVKTCISEAAGENYYSEEHMSKLFSSSFELDAVFNPDDEMIGIAGISQGIFNTEMSTLSTLNIRSGYTGLGVATALLSHIVSKLRKRNVRAIKGNSVAWHTSSQHILEQLGLRPTGLLFGIKDGMNSNPKHHGKRSLAVYVDSVSVHDAGTLYIHEALAQKIRFVYAGIKVKAQILTDGKCGNATVLKHKYNEHDDTLNIQVLESAEDLVEKINDFIRQYETGRSAVVIYMNLCTPTAVFGSELMLKSGFRFCGADPLGEGEHALFHCGDAGDMNELRMSEILEEFWREVGIA